MLSRKILMSNLGYARGIDGSLIHHLRYAHRHVYCAPAVQQKVLEQVSSLIEMTDPDICCFVEIDQGSANSAHFNQFEALLNEKYPFFDVENKYGSSSMLRYMGLTKGKSNAFLAKHELPYEKVFFDKGFKRLIYKISLAHDITLFFAHFSLNKKVRSLQLEQVKILLETTPGEVIFLGDFNILEGLQEIAPLLENKDMVLLNSHTSPTFTFHKRQLILDLCICSKGIAPHAHLDVIPQPFSDHAALLLQLH